MICRAVFVDNKYMLGEGPVWDIAQQCLYWVDILRHKVFCLDIESNNVRHKNAPAYPSAVVCTSGSDLLLAAKGVVGLFCFEKGGFLPLAKIETNISTNRCNDAKCDPLGTFWVGTMAHDEREGQGSLYKLDSKGTVQRLLSGMTVPNGMAWDVANGAFYHIDSPTKSIRRYMYESCSGQIGMLTGVISIEQEGWPDGMVIDRDGMLWVALWDGWAVVRIDPTSGRTVARIDLPVSRPTSCAFGGADMSILYVTSAYVGIEDIKKQPLAGALFAIEDIGTKGIASHKFKI